MELVRRRLYNREIAELLQIRVSTIKFHLSNILSKMHVNSRSDQARRRVSNVCDSMRIVTFLCQQIPCFVEGDKTSLNQEVR
jgi:Bacterial regulatory proteins, luxR family